MEHKPYLIFSLRGLRYGVDAYLVQEIFHLPELTPIADAPEDIIGLLNLRSKILPVMHLDLRFGHSLQECRLTDSVIVLKWEELQLGIIVNQVHEVQPVSPEVIEAEIAYGRAKEANSRFIAGVAKVEADMIMLLNHEKLLRHSDEVEALLPDEASDEPIEGADHTPQPQGLEQEHRGSVSLSSFYARYCPNATSEERVVFQARAVALRRSTETSDFTGLVPLAVVGLNGEYFGLDLEVVREFIDIRNVTPIPCCPAHVVGNMNLRGEVVTLVDIRGALDMPIAATGTASKAIVTHVNDLVAGVPVDQVFDVMYLDPSEVMPVPSAVQAGSNAYLRGTAPYAEKMLSILDLPKILTAGELVVNEEV